MLRFALAIFLFLFALPASSQLDSSIVKHHLIISASPHHMLDIFHGASVNFGFEVRSNDKYCFYGEYGMFLPSSPVANNYEQTGYTMAGELKRYFGKGIFYASCQYMFGEQGYRRSDIVGYTEDSDSWVTYTVQKKFYDFSLRGGALLKFDSNLTLNPYLGFGFRFQNANVDLSDELARDRQYEGSTPRWIHRSGKTTYPKMHAGIRIGYAIF